MLSAREAPAVHGTLTRFFFLELRARWRERTQQRAIICFFFLIQSRGGPHFMLVVVANPDLVI